MHKGKGLITSINTTILTQHTIRNIILLIVPLSISVLIGIMYNLSQAVENVTKEMINNTIGKVDNELESVIKPVIIDLNMIRELSVNYDLDSNTVGDFNWFMRPIIENNSNIKSGFYSNSKGEEFMLSQINDTIWQNRFSLAYKGITKPIIEYEWYKTLKSEMLLIKKSIDTINNNDPRKKLWYTNSQKYKADEYAWTSPYFSTNTGELGISVSTHWQNDKDSSIEITASLNVLFKDIIEYMNNIKISDNGHAILFTDDNTIICQSNHEKFACSDSLRKYSLTHFSQLGMPYFDAMKKASVVNKIGFSKPFRFELAGKNWWAEIATFDKYGLRNMQIAVLVPESDFMAEMNRARMVVVLGFILIFILIVISLNAYRKQHKLNISLNDKNNKIASQRDKLGNQKNEIEKQHDKIQEIHSEVTNSIVYAKRIQSSALPNMSILKENVKDSFVLFEPRDVVSGDFYFFSKIDNKLVVIVADCTGHGVPGAFMSMLGMSMIDHIILDKCQLDPSIVLNRLRKNIIHALGQSKVGEGQRDGMDMSVCILDLDTKILKYSGANNPIMILSKNHKEWGKRKEVKSMRSDNLNLFKIKADNMPISIYLKMNDFVTHEYQLESDDVVYLFSDGYIDQFGGDTKELRMVGGKKFKIKAFQELLLSIAEKPLNEQHQILKTRILDWRGEINQIDDISILGFRI